MSQIPVQMDHANKAYVAITYDPSSTFLTAPAALASLEPLQSRSVAYVGQVGELNDVHLYCAPKNQGNAVENWLKERRGGSEGIVDVELQVPKMRAKRDEL